jgi:purine-cytosine permease-like protein
MTDKTTAWTAKAMSAVVVVLTVAVGARVAWWLLAPLVPVLVVLVGLGVVYAVVLGRFRR